MSYKIEFKSSAERDLERIGPRNVQRVWMGIETLADDPLPSQSLKLAGVERLYRLRVGTYRVIYEVDLVGEAVVIHYIRHRREAYRNL